MTSGGSRRLFWIVGAVVVLIDVITKQMAVAALTGRSGIALIGDWFAFRLVYNQGAAFGLYLGPYSRWIFTGLALLALIVLGAMVLQTPPRHRFRLVALGLVCGGAIGNLIDRIRSSAGVVDFIDVWIGRFHWPTFNVADMAVSCGAVALAVILWSEGKESVEQAANPTDAAEASS